MMKRIFIPLVSFCLFILFIGLSGCEVIEDIACKKGEGTRITQERDLQDFSEVLIDMPGDIYISQGSEFAVNVTAQENIQDEISTTVNGEMLEVVNLSCLGDVKTVRVDITLPSLKGLEVKNSADVYGQTSFASDLLRLTVDGSGSIEIEGKIGEGIVEMEGSGTIFADLAANDLNTTINGSGDITLSGSTQVHNIDMDRSGKLSAFELMSLSSIVMIDGRGDCEISVQDSLNVTIKASGNVFYKGSPAISVDISGSGDLQDAN